MYVCQIGQFRIESGEFEVVRCEQRVSARGLCQMARNRVGERESVEGGRAASDFINQHQTLAGCGIEDRCGFGHLHHERRAPTGKVVGCADARHDGIDGTDLGARRGNEQPGVCQEYDLGHLPHVG